jgi:hypothetical protein
MRLNRCLWILAVCCFLTVPVFADEAPAKASDNVRVTFHVGHMLKGKDVVQKTYEMVVAANGERVEMSTGARIPIPTTSFKVSEDGTRVGAPVTAYTYQQVGFSAAVRASILADGSIGLSGRVEDSSLIDEPAADGRPFIQSMNQHLSVTLVDGQPLRINSVDETGTRSFFLRLQADRLNHSDGRISANRGPAAVGH